MKTFKKIYFYIFILTIFISGKAFGQEPVVMTCTKVMDDGTVNIYWNNPDLSEFDHYDIYHSSGTVFNKLITIDNISDNYTHDTNLGNLAQQFYYVDIVDINGNSKISDTVATIYLQLDNNAPDFNKADLFWTMVSEPHPVGTNGWYKVYWDYPDGNWYLIDSTENNLFSSDIIVCYDSISFRIELKNDNCSSVSNIRRDLFKDVEYPSQTVFDSVSITDDSRAVLGWQPSVSLDVAGYIIYHLELGSWIEFDTVVGWDNTFYIDTLYDACIENQEYAIAAIDSCGNKSEGTFLDPQRPIFLYDIGFNVCAQQDTLIWEQYENANPGVDNYIVWRSDNGSEFITVSTLPPPAIDTIKMLFIDEGIDPGTTYEYFVQAVFASGTSSSCKKSPNSYTYKLPQHIYFANADVLLTNEIDLVVDVDTSVYSCTWELYRYDPITNSNNNFSSTEKIQLQGFPLNILDAEVDPQNTFYEYYVLVFDSCGIERYKSNTLKTIHLNGSKIDQQTNRLTWNSFEGWETEVEKYYIYRFSGDDETNFLIIDSVNGLTLQYDDNISIDEATEGKLTYWVEAKQTTGGEFDYESYSNSNRIDIFFESNVYFPNAFRPGSTNIENNEFKPIFNYFSGSNYLFQIFNRWGQMVFETTDTEEGWNGLIEGQHQKSGLYVYRLSYKNIYGLDVDKKGTVMLLQ